MTPLRHVLLVYVDTFKRPVCERIAAAQLNNTLLYHGLRDEDVLIIEGKVLKEFGNLLSPELVNSLSK